MPSRLPLLRLYRTALGRDPSGPDLALLELRQTQGATLQALAQTLLASPEARHRHGPPDTPADLAFTQRALESAGDAHSPLAPTLTGPSRAKSLAMLAETKLFQTDTQPMPTIYADRRPDDPAAYAWWRQHCERRPVRPPVDRHLRIVMPFGDTTIEAATRSLAALTALHHQRWSLLLIGTVLSPWAQTTLTTLLADPRVTAHPTDIPAAFNAAKDLVCLLAPGDVLANDALEWALAPFADPAVTLVMTDEDRQDPTHGRAAPRLKPHPCENRMRAGNAIGQLAVYSAAAATNIGGLRTQGATDLARRLFQADPAGLRHIPHVLVHTAAPSPDDPPPGHAWPIIVPTPPTDWPLVSILLPSRNRADLLAAVMRGLLDQTDYASFELIVIDHESTQPEAVALLATLATDPRVRILPFVGPFNFAAINNRAAELAQGEILLLLNNDIEILHSGWLAEMVAHALNPTIGLVGARLLGRDGRLQHAGIALGPNAQARHLFRGAPKGDPGYLGMIATTRDVSAVTGACMALRRAVWTQLGGMDETFPVAWNDIDFCQRVRAAGLRILYTPHAVLTHLEGETRGIDAADQAKLRAFEADRDRYHAIWGPAADHDPFLNPNLAATDHELCLAPPRTTGVL